MNDKYWLGFNLSKGIGSAKTQYLLDYFGSLEQAWGASESQLQKIGLDRRAIRQFLTTRDTIDLDAEWQKLETSGYRLLTWQSPEYPSALRNIPTSPPVLYVWGDISPTDQQAIAVVGTRRLTQYGRQMTRQLVQALVSSGFAIISGLARGIDAIAHQTALEMGGRTIGVLGSGLNRFYPAQNRKLAEQIANGQGAVITEYALETPPDAKNFPPRNRIVSGLSLGTLVVEAGEKSGALITANFALDQGREVFALPGYITSKASLGTNRLIQQGAKLVLSVEDILEELQVERVVAQTAVRHIIPASTEEEALLNYLSQEPIHIDELARQTEMSTHLVSSTLTLMELKGMVQQVGGMTYVRNKLL